MTKYFAKAAEVDISQKADYHLHGCNFIKQDIFEK